MVPIRPSSSSITASLRTSGIQLSPGATESTSNLIPYSDENSRERPWKHVPTEKKGEMSGSGLADAPATSVKKSRSHALIFVDDGFVS